MLKRTCITTALVLLSACKDDEPNSRASFCRAIGGGGAQASVTCVSSCGTISNESAAVDANFDSYATLGVSVQSQAALRGTAQDGVVFAEGLRAGVYLHEEPLVRGSFQVTINTYLDGVPVDSQVAYARSDNGGVNFCNFDCLRNGDEMFIGIPASGPFDAIEMAYSQNGTQYREIQVFEFCTRG